MADLKPQNTENNIRCSHCACPLLKNMKASDSTLSKITRESLAMNVRVCQPEFDPKVGSAAGGTISSYYGYNFVMPVVRRYVKGPMWLQYLIGMPPVIVFTSACTGLAGGAFPSLAQLASTSYHAAYPSPPSPTPSPVDKRRRSGTSTS